MSDENKVTDLQAERLRREEEAERMELSKAARAYATETQFVDHTGNEEAARVNSRMMAFSAGARWYKKKHEKELAKFIEEEV